MALLDLFRKNPRFVVPADPRTCTTRTQLLNYLVAKHGYRRYLEIGVRRPASNFDHVNVRDKQGVDPAANATHRMTSDDYFAKLAADPIARPFDLIFVDGLHTADQVARDVDNGLRFLAPGGALVLHDCHPLTAKAQSDDFFPDGIWNGTVWKAWAALRGTRADLSMCVVDIDHGCGVIRPGSQELFAPLPPLESLTYAFLDANRKALLNLVSVAQFIEIDDAVLARRKRAHGSAAAVDSVTA